MCTKFYSTALQSELNTARSRLMDKNATLTKALAEKGKLEEEMDEMRHQQAGVVHEFEEMVQEVQQARSSGENALRDLTAKYEKDMAALRYALLSGSPSLPYPSSLSFQHHQARSQAAVSVTVSHEVRMPCGCD